MRLRRTGSVPPGARVRHYDQLRDEVQTAVHEVAGRPHTTSETGALDDGDVVKFTDYYLVRSR